MVVQLVEAQAGTSQVSFLVVTPEFTIDILLLATLWPWR